MLQSLGVFAASFARLLPVITTIYSGAIQFYSSRERISIYYKELNANISMKKEEPFPKLYQEGVKKFNEINFKDVSFSYPGSNNQVLDKVNLTIKKNEIIGIIGSSGAGKSTFIDLASGFMTPTHGHILVDSKDIQSNIQEGE